MTADDETRRRELGADVYVTSLHAAVESCLNQATAAGGEKAAT